MHLMMDIETLGVRHDSAILSVAIVPFRLEESGVTSGEFIDVAVKIGTQKSAFIDDATLRWWLTQPDGSAAQEALRADRKDAAVAGMIINEFLNRCERKDEHGIEGLWAHGPVFDVAMVQRMMELAGMTPAWNYRKIRDTRTLQHTLEHLGLEVPPKADPTHSAFQDCVDQITWVQACHRALKAGRPPYRGNEINVWRET